MNKSYAFCRHTRGEQCGLSQPATEGRDCSSKFAKLGSEDVSSISSTKEAVQLNSPPRTALLSRAGLSKRAGKR